jgi:outer membrane biosynthesis protein TonB
MKSFFQFLTEATQSQASMQAKKLGLKGDGHGGWVDRAGKVVARTEDGKLKFTEKRTPKGQEEPKADTQKTAAPAPQPKTQAAPDPKAAPAKATEPAPRRSNTRNPTTYYCIWKI